MQNAYALFQGITGLSRQTVMKGPQMLHVRNHSVALNQLNVSKRNRIRVDEGKVGISARSERCVLELLHENIHEVRLSAYLSPLGSCIRSTEACWILFSQVGVWDPESSLLASARGTI